MRFTLLTFLALIISTAACADVWTTDQMVEYTKCSNFRECDFLKKKEVRSISTYQGQSWINGVLRSSKKLDFDSKKIIKRLDSAVGKSQFPKELLLFRGVNLNYRANRPYEVNEEFVDMGYLSTSINPKHAFSFAKSAFYILYHNQNFNGIWMGKMEDEVILARGLKFKVMNSVVHNKKLIQIVQICNVSCNDQVPADALNILDEL